MGDGVVGGNGWALGGGVGGGRNDGGGLQMHGGGGGHWIEPFMATTKLSNGKILNMKKMLMVVEAEAIIDIILVGVRFDYL